jgi:hypothetical protein
VAISTPTTVTASGSTANAGTYDTAAVTLTANRLYVIVCTGYRAGGGTNMTSITHDPLGTPLAFSEVTGQNGATWDAAAHRSMEIYYVIPASTTANALVRIVWAATQSSMGWRLMEIQSGFDPTGGTTTFPQSTITVDAGAGTAIAATMSSFGATDNLTLLCMGWGQGTANPSETIAATESRSELGEHNDGERTSQGVHYQNPHGSDTSVGATLSANQEWAIAAIEVAAASTASNISGSDTVTESEALTALTLAGAVADSSTLTDALTALFAAWSLTDTLTLTDTPSVLASLTAADSVTVADALTALSGQVSATDLATLTDTLTAFSVAWQLTDTVTLSETAAAHANVMAVDSATLTDTGSASFVGGVDNESDVDSATVSETLAIQVDLVAADAIAMADTMAINALLSPAGDSLTLSDTLGPLVGDLALVDSLALADALNYHTDWSLSDTWTLTDSGTVVPTFSNQLNGKARGRVTVDPLITGTGKVGRVG